MEKYSKLQEELSEKNVEIARLKENSIEVEKVMNKYRNLED